MNKVLIYLHGFLSSPQSVKGQQTLRYAQAHWPQLQLEMPQLPPYPLPAERLLRQLVAKHQGKELYFIGSSLGGYLATWLVENYGGKAVLINPAVKPYELLQDYLGEQYNSYTAERFTLTAEHMQQLRTLDARDLRQAENYLVLLQQGDEVLDYRLAERQYQGSQLVVEPGGDHSFVDYDQHLPNVFEFLFG